MTRHSKTYLKRRARAPFIREYERARKEVCALIQSYLVEVRLRIVPPNVERVEGKELAEYAAKKLQDLIEDMGVPPRNRKFKRGDQRFYDDLLANRILQPQLDSFVGPQPKFTRRADHQNVSKERIPIYSEWRGIIAMESDESIVTNPHTGNYSFSHYVEGYFFERVLLNSLVRCGVEALQRFSPGEHRGRKAEAAYIAAIPPFRELLQKLGPASPGMSG